MFYALAESILEHITIDHKETFDTGAAHVILKITTPSASLHALRALLFLETRIVHILLSFFFCPTPPPPSPQNRKLCILNSKTIYLILSAVNLERTIF